MKWLVGCEESGEVRRALRALGHEAYSCDLIPASDGETRYHILGDIRDQLHRPWDGLIAFPPCTDLAVSGAAWFPAKRADGRQDRALGLVRDILAAPIPRIAMENPVGIISSKIRPPDQIIQPWQFGHSAMKSTCLWLKNLPPLVPTNVVDKGVVHVHASGRRSSEWSMSTFKLPKEIRARERSKTFPGIAQAMADQWGNYTTPQLALTL